VTYAVWGSDPPRPAHKAGLTDQVSYGAHELRRLDSNQDERLNRPPGYRLPDTGKCSADGTRTRNVSVKGSRLSHSSTAPWCPGKVSNLPPLRCRRSALPLSYRDRCAAGDLNPETVGLKAPALPVELAALGALRRSRTCGRPLRTRLLYPLS
jgi:hypothetical protein